LTHIPRLCVLVGANGTGKSTLFDVFSFLKDALSMNVTKAVAKRGGTRNWSVVVMPVNPIEFALQFPLRNRSRTSRDLSAPDRTGQQREDRRCREVLRYKRSSYGAPYHFLDFGYGKGYASPTRKTFPRLRRP
jgi:predicted ATPase